MDLLKVKAEEFFKWRKALKFSRDKMNDFSMPGDAYFIDDDNILTIPRDDGDCRYPYGKNGFNFWAYTSGYLHANEGLLSVFLRANEGQEPKIAFFAGIPHDSGYTPLSLLSVPVLDNEGQSGIEAERFTVFTKACAYYMTEANGIRFVVRIFPDEKNDIFITIGVYNLENTAKRIFLSSFMNPFLRHNIAEGGENRWFREVRYVKKDDSDSDPGSFVIKVNEDINRTTSVSNVGVIRRNMQFEEGSRLIGHEETASRYQYVGGSRSSLHSALSLRTGSFENARHVCAFTEIGAAGDIIHISLGEYGTVRYDMAFSYKVHCSDEKEIDSMLCRETAGIKVDKKVEEFEIAERKSNGLLHCKVANVKDAYIKENVFNSFLVHLKKQVEFCSLIKGYVQLTAGSLIGIRDIFQALEGLLFWQVEASRRKMLEAFGFILVDGRCPRQYSLPVPGVASPDMDLRLFIDQGAWLISTVVTYLKVTGDTGFLHEYCGYYEIVDEKRNFVKTSSKRDSVLQHLLKVMDFLLSNRDFEETGCIRALYGDWNDALDGLGVSKDPEKEYGTGVSVMASLQVYQNLDEMVDLLNWVDKDKYASIIEYYSDARIKLADGIKKYAVVCGDNGEKRIVHGWGDKRSYYVGGFNDIDCKSRYSLTSNAYWVVSRMYDSDQSVREMILNTFQKLDSKYGFKTFEPHFQPNTPGVGRIPKLPAGTAENGAVYIHASTFAVMALFRMGRSEDAWNQLYKLLPFSHEKVSCSPYVMPNSYGFNKDKSIDGESMLDWQTGSSNVILKTLIRYVFGIEPEFEGIWIQPASWSPFEGFEFQVQIRSCKVCIEYKNVGRGQRNYKVNGVERPGIYNEVMNLERLWISREELDNSCIGILVSD